VVAAFTAHWLQEQNREYVSFKEIARSRAIYFMPAASPAVEFLKKLRPGRSHKHLRGKNNSKFG
jgi:hypothetical protein